MSWPCCSVIRRRIEGPASIHGTQVGTDLSLEKSHMFTKQIRGLDPEEEVYTQVDIMKGLSIEARCTLSVMCESLTSCRRPKGGEDQKVRKAKRWGGPKGGRTNSGGSSRISWKKDCIDDIASGRLFITLKFPRTLCGKKQTAGVIRIDVTTQLQKKVAHE